MWLAFVCQSVLNKVAYGMNLIFNNCLSRSFAVARHLCGLLDLPCLLPASPAPAVTHCRPYLDGLTA